MKSGPRRVFRYSSRYEKTLPDGSIRCRMDLHRILPARPQRIWTTKVSEARRLEGSSVPEEEGQEVMIPTKLS
jgi:hypothetical protein